MATLVMKFGGTSVGSPDAITQAVDIVGTYSSQWERLAVVVSAMRGVTDILIKSAASAALGDEESYKSLISDLRNRHHSVIDELISNDKVHAQLIGLIEEHIDDLSAYCRSIQIHPSSCLPTIMPWSGQLSRWD